VVEEEAAGEVVGAKKTKAKGKHKRKGTAASKKPTDQKTAAREAKMAKEAAAVVRAASVASKKKMAKMMERLCLEKEERLLLALGDLQPLISRGSQRRRL
jgi:hypothetical protein